MILEHDPLLDTEIQNYVDTLFPKITLDKLMEVPYYQFDEVWRNWLLNNTYNQVHGLDDFKHSTFIPGTTDAFGEFIARHSARRLRVSRSDFIITKVLSQTYSRDFKYLEDEELDANDCIVLSIPFSGNGSKHPDQDKILDVASELSVPVFIDAAYYGISHDVHYPLDKTCVSDFVVSLSKNMVGDPLRLGIRFTKKFVDDCASAPLIGADIFDRVGAFVSIQLLNQFPQKYIIDKYKPLSEQICLRNKIKTTNTITLAIDDQGLYEFKRGDYARVCITDELVKLSGQ